VPLHGQKLDPACPQCQTELVARDGAVPHARLHHSACGGTHRGLCRCRWRLARRRACR
jgi:hypothetical protein